MEELTGISAAEMVGQGDHAYAAPSGVVAD
jgi:hypothetical protein